MLKKTFKNIRLFIAILAVTVIGNATFITQAAPRVQATDEELVIVIDPGHGGENLGTIENGFEEKTMTLITAQAMYDELVQYDDVTVYMTRTEDKDMSLKERAEFAASVNADFLFSLHYNASANHTHFGSEIWISSVAPYNAYSYQFGYVYMTEMQDMGLFLRGIKTRLNDEGTDYYGVIRESVALSVPAVILEHCHVDEDRDVPYCATEEEWIAFGKRDALAVAKYFGLSSASLNVDYSQESLNLPEVNAETIVQSTVRDETPPDVCMIELADVNYDTGEVVVSITATDYDSPLLYYNYSIDGGATFSDEIPWPGTDLLNEKCPDTVTIDMTIPSGTEPEIIVRAFNLADLYTESNSLPFLQTFYYGEAVAKTEEIVKNQPSSEIDSTAEKEPVSFAPVNAEAEPENAEVSFMVFLKICLIFVIILFFMVIVSQSISNHIRRKRRRQRIKELEERTYHRK